MEDLTKNETNPEPNVESLAKAAAEKELTETALVFGQSEESLSREFKKFKAMKLFAKIFCDLTAVTESNEFDEKLSDVIEYGFGGAFVLPADVVKTKTALSEKNLTTFACVCYPFGEEGAGVKKLAVKRAISAGAGRVLVSVGLKTIKSGNYDFIKREIKKCLKVNKSIKITALLECGSLTQEETERTVKVLSAIGVTSFCGGSGFRGKSETGGYKLLRSGIKSGGELIAISQEENSGDVISLFHVADAVIAKDCKKIAEKIREKLSID